MTTQPTKEALEPTLEDLATEAAAFLESAKFLQFNELTRAQQIAFALRSRVSAPIAPVVDEERTQYDEGWDDAVQAIKQFGIEQIEALLAAPAPASPAALKDEAEGRQRAIRLLRKLREGTDPAEVERQKESSESILMRLRHYGRALR